MIFDVDKAKVVTKRLAASECFGIISYEEDWSEMTPGDGPAYGCRYCNAEARSYSPDYASDKSLVHVDDCIWMAARKLWGMLQ